MATKMRCFCSVGEDEGSGLFGTVQVPECGDGCCWNRERCYECDGTGFVKAPVSLVVQRWHPTKGGLRGEFVGEEDNGSKVHLLFPGSADVVVVDREDCQTW